MENNLGSYPNELILSKLKPSYWFSAHLHVHYAAIVDHDMWKKGEYPPSTQQILNGNRGNQYQKPVVENPDEIDISLSDDDEISEPKEADKKPAEPKITKFLSLDKCLPRRQFLQVSMIPIIINSLFTILLDYRHSYTQ